MRDFNFTYNKIWTGNLWMSSPALCHCATVTSVFHLWQYQVFNTGAEGLVMVLFWLDLWWTFIFPTMGFELGIFGSQILHFSNVPQWLLVLTSDNFMHLTLVHRNWCWYCSDWTCERFSCCPQWDLNLGLLDLKSCTWPLCHSDFLFSPLIVWGINSGSKDLVVVLFWLDH